MKLFLRFAFFKSQDLCCLQLMHYIGKIYESLIVSVLLLKICIKVKLKISVNLRAFWCFNVLMEEILTGFIKMNLEVFKKNLVFWIFWRKLWNKNLGVLDFNEIEKLIWIKWN